jgi:dihydroorotate dehydrogenase
MRPWLLLPASWAHSIGPIALNFYGRLRPFQRLTWSPFTWNHLTFQNRLGIAGGVDKDATQVQAWWSLGTGFLEIGTVTPRPQPGHSGKRLGRDCGNEAVWNRLGFPSRGVEFVAQQLEKLPRPRFTPLFANVGKNKDTPLEKAHEDYIACIRRLHGLADGFVINLSSPNTAGLRDLLKPEYLTKFLEPIIGANRSVQNGGSRTPLLLKVSPDLSLTDLAQVLDTSERLGVDGWVLTNSSQGLREGLAFPPEGGVSGRPLAPAGAAAGPRGRSLGRAASRKNSGVRRRRVDSRRRL